MGIIINCAKCGAKKEKSNSHYNEAIKKEKKIYCSISCAQLDRVVPYNLTVDKKTVKYLFEYHKEGYLTWVNPTTIRTKIGDIVGHKQLFSCGGKGQHKWVTRLNKRLYLIHKIIFLYHYGYMPKIVDHIDRNNLNNKIENLREATSSQNNCNRTPSINKTSKYLGVHLNKHNKWIAQIKSSDTKQYIGSFSSEIEAALAYNEKAKETHGEFANLNII